ncbi:type 4a pilus biogenesis protein PilO [Patescibacteria group bacterium]|nr:type 4a pilus biogenesis protein PilO [Patescibacteria group bacterium]
MKIGLKKNLEALQKNKYLQLLPSFKEEKTQKFTTLILTITFLALFSLFAINPTLSTIAKLQKELEDNKHINQQIQTKIANLSLLEARFNEIQGDLPIVLSSVPNKTNIPFLIGEIEAVAKDSGVNILGLQSYEVETESGKKAESNPTSFSFSLNAEGTRENINLFISNLISMRRIVTLSLISLSNDKGENELMKVNVKGEAYFKK